MLDFQERVKLAQKTKESDEWRHRKSGKIVTVIGRRNRFDVHLRHDSGRETYKQDHYLASDYEPVSQASQSN
jgi:hypothetical protein